MRILQVSPRHAPAWAFGGGVRMGYILGRCWAARGHEVTVFTSDQKDAKERFAETVENLAGMRIRRFRNPSHRLAVRLPSLFFRPRGLKSALSRIRGQFDVVHVIESRGPHNRWVAEGSLASGVPYFWSAYGGLADGTGARRLYRHAHDLAYNTRRLVQGAAGLIAQTSHEEAVYCDFGADRSTVRIIPLAIEPDDFRTLPPKGAFRARLGVGEKEKMILFLGRLHQTKGVDLLIKSFARTLRSVPSARLVLVGWDHGFRAVAERLVGDLGLRAKVLFAGALYGDERILAYADCDVFALTPGVYEETSLAALEACACARPCVITRQCEIPGLDQAGAGVTTAYDVGEVAAALERVLDGETCARMGMNARRLAVEKFSAATVARQHEELFAESLQTTVGL